MLHSGSFTHSSYPSSGGRNFTIFSTLTLLIPTLWMALAVQNPGTSYVVFVVIALLCGLGGGNFSASMAHISFFFPKKIQGTALGWNAGIGNLGVGIMQAAGKDQTAQAAAITAGDVEASVALGFTSAIAALGLFFIPAFVATSIQTTGSAHLALSVFSAFYASCMLACWWWYWRKGAEARCD